jgi:hypothetical protein
VAGGSTTSSKGVCKGLLKGLRKLSVQGLQETPEASTLEQLAAPLVTSLSSLLHGLSHFVGLSFSHVMSFQYQLAVRPSSLCSMGLISPPTAVDVGTDAPHILGLTLGYWDTACVLARMQGKVSSLPGASVTLLCPAITGREFVQGEPGWTLCGCFNVCVQDFLDHGCISPGASVPEPWSDGSSPVLELQAWRFVGEDRVDQSPSKQDISRIIGAPV